MGIQQFERRLERLVEGTFARAFRSGVQPVEIARKVVREMEAGRTLGVKATVVPNHFTVLLSPDDAETLGGYHDTLARELEDAAREHARGEGYRFLGPVVVDLRTDPSRARGDLRVQAAITEGASRAARLVLPDGRTISLEGESTVIGRVSECDVTLSDPQVSRRHAEIRFAHDGYHLVDLGSTNGTYVAGVPVRDRVLSDGDEITVGSVVLRFQES